MQSWEHKLTTVSIYTAVFSSAMQYFNFETMKYFGIGFFSSLAGAHFPDFDIKIFGPGSSPEGFINVYGHRGIMHYYKLYVLLYVLLSLALLFIDLFYFNFDGLFFLIIFSMSCFFFGAFMHILEDAPTTAGVPVKRYKSLKPGEKLYVAYSYKMGSFDSASIKLIALSAVGISLAVTAYNVLTKFFI